MSEARRKKQQKKGAKPESGTSLLLRGSVFANPSLRGRLTWIGIGVVLMGSYGVFWYHNNHRYDDFAKCLSTKQAKMYGAYWCPHCAEQKEEFGKSFRYVNYVECAIKDSREMAPACKAAGVQHYPTWQFGSGPLIEGKFPMQELSDKTGCSLP